jgi:hypothetical protein
MKFSREMCFVSFDCLNLKPAAGKDHSSHFRTAMRLEIVASILGHKKALAIGNRRLGHTKMFCTLTALKGKLGTWRVYGRPNCGSRKFFKLEHADSSLRYQWTKSASDICKISRVTLQLIEQYVVHNSSLIRKVKVLKIGELKTEPTMRKSKVKL